MSAAALISTSEEELGLLTRFKPLVEDLWNAESTVPGSTEAKKHQDDGTLLRFIAARDTVEEAANMYRTSMTWREEVDIEAVWASRQTPEGVETLSDLSKLAQSAFYGLVLSGSDGMTKQGGPIMFERLGKVDMAGIGSEEKLTEEIVLSYMAHLEHSWRTARAAEGGRGKALVVVDLSGLSMSHITNIGIIKRIAGIGPPRFPETTAGVAIVNAPWVFSAVYKVISPLLPENTRAKIQILGSDFLHTLRDKLDEKDIPTFLGGTSWVGEDSSHKAATLKNRAVKVDRKELAKAIKAQVNKDFIIEAQDNDIDMDEMPGGFRRFRGARNSVSLTKEEMLTYKNSLGKMSEEGGESKFQVKKVEVSEEDLSEIPGGTLRFTGARNSISVAKQEMKEKSTPKKGPFNGFFGGGKRG